MDAKAAALAAAPAVAAKIEHQFGETVGSSAIPHVAAVLYERDQHKITFTQLREVFESEGTSLTRPTLRRYRGLVNDLDRPEAVLQRLEQVALPPTRHPPAHCIMRRIVALQEAERRRVSATNKAANVAVANLRTQRKQLRCHCLLLRRHA